MYSIFPELIELMQNRIHISIKIVSVIATSSILELSLNDRHLILLLERSLLRLFFIFPKAVNSENSVSELTLTNTIHLLYHALSAPKIEVCVV